MICKKWHKKLRILVARRISATPAESVRSQRAFRPLSLSLSLSLPRQQLTFRDVRNGAFWGLISSEKWEDEPRKIEHSF